MVKLKEIIDGLNPYTFSVIRTNFGLIENFINGKIDDTLAVEAFGQWMEENTFKPKEAVATFSALPTDPELKELRGVTEENKAYVYNGESWVVLNEFDFNALDFVESRIDYEEKKRNELDYYGMLTQNSTDYKGHLLTVNGDRVFQASIKLTDREYIRYNFKKNANDDFIKFRDADLLTQDRTTVRQDYSSVTSGSMTSTSSNNHYTTEVGTTITQDFIGTGIFLYHFVNDQGGMWKASVDGVEVARISTHIDAAVDSWIVAYQLSRSPIAIGLENTTHTLTLEFIGQDPAHPVASPRGWIRINDNSSAHEPNNQESFEWTEVAEATVKTYTDSNKEFAFLVSPSAEQYDLGNSVWMPEHSGIGTLFLGDTGYQELYIDGVLSGWNNVADKEFTEIKLVQKLHGNHSYFGGDFCEAYISMTINYRGVKFESKITWLTDVYIRNGYVNMMTLHPDFATELTSSYGAKYDLTLVDGSNEEISENKPYQWIATSSLRENFFATMSSNNPAQSYRIGQIGSGSETFAGNLYFLQHRDTTLQKLYPRSYVQHTVGAGEVLKFDGHFGFGFIPKVYYLV